MVPELFPPFLMAVIEWSADPVIFQLGPIAARWYGLLFAGSFFVGFYLMRYMYKGDGRNPDEVERLLMYAMVGTVVGARLGHCYFYEPAYYLQHPLEVLEVWNGGLASHGAAVGILTAMWLYARKTLNESFLRVTDRVVVTVALAGVFIRLGNLFNSEIIGTPTEVPWAFVFTRVDLVPRHPSQLYEAVWYLVVFVVLFRMWNSTKARTPHGRLLGVFLIMVFGGRFAVEMLKENQVGFEDSLALNMGQILSIPAVLGGLFLLLRHRLAPNSTPGGGHE